MLRFFGWLLTTAVALLIVLAAAAWFVLRDPNQLKPQLIALIEAQTGVPVRIEGDLSWQLWPPLSLGAAGVSADHDDTRYTLEQLNLEVDLGSVLANRNVDDWQVKALELTKLELASDTDSTVVNYLRLRDFTPGELAPFEVGLEYSSDGSTIPLTATGMLAYHPDGDQVELGNTRFETTDAAGLCELDAVIVDSDYAGTSADSNNAIIPIEIWRGFDWQGECLLDRLQLADADFANVRIELDNTGGNSTTTVVIPDFFGGNASATLDIDARREPVVWRIEPDLDDVDSQALMTWLDQPLRWVAPLSYNGAITMTGNTEAELTNSANGVTRFDGGQGRIDLSRIKQPLLALATLFREGERIQKWPELWEYERMTGDWVIRGKTHELDMKLDNLTAAIDGDYDPATDDVNAQVDIVFEDNPGMHSFDVNPLLIGVPIPLECLGKLENPSCRVDTDAARRIVATVLTSEQGGELRAKLDKKIDEEVPEEYQDAARSLLDLLGRSLEKNKPDN